MIQINGTALPSPSGLTVTVKPIAGAGARNTLGALVRDTLAVKRVISLAWRRLDQATLAAMLALTEGVGDVTLHYCDPALGETSVVCAIAAREMTMERDGGAPVWRDVTMTLEER